MLMMPPKLWCHCRRQCTSQDIVCQTDVNPVCIRTDGPGLLVRLPLPLHACQCCRKASPARIHTSAERYLVRLTYCQTHPFIL